jgi:hypothetical protein
MKLHEAEHEAEHGEEEALDEIRFYRYVPKCCGESALIHKGAYSHRCRARGRPRGGT